MRYETQPTPEIPPALLAHFQDYDVSSLDSNDDANLLIQRTLEFGDWDEIRWLFGSYNIGRISTYLREFGERGLSPVTFNYWRKLRQIRK